MIIELRNAILPQSIPKGLTRQHVLAAIADLDGGIEHDSGKPTGDELVYDGKRYLFDWTRKVEPS